MNKNFILILVCLVHSIVVSAQWSLSGNSISGSNFLGSTNAQALVFKANNTQVGQLQYGSSANVSLGVNAGNGWSTLCCNVAIGYRALAVNTSANNTAIGNSALNANTGGEQNTAIGSGNSNAITTGSYNTAVGTYALLSATTGTNNSAFGPGSLTLLINGSFNAAYGVASLNSNTASNNNAFGYRALYRNTTGTPNSAFGYNALLSNTTGSNNVAMGNATLSVNTTGSQNTAVGDDAGPVAGSTNLSNTGAFGYGATVNASNQIILGNASVTQISGYTSFTNISDGRFKKHIRENIPGLSFIKLLRPVTYHLDATGISNITMAGKQRDRSDVELAALKEKEQIRYAGFVAQEVESSARAIGFDFSGVAAPRNDKDFYRISYADFVVPLVKAVQELSGANDSLKAMVSDLSAQLLTIQQQLKKINQSLVAGDIPVLKQNAPNPFEKNAVIAYSLPSNTQKALLTITDVQGRVLKNVALNNSKGPGQAVIHAGTLPAGIYYYSLVINGKLIDTKEMVLAK